MKRIMAPMAYQWGRMATSYTLRAAPPGRARLVGAENLPADPVIFIGWHAANLIELTLMVRLSHRRFCSFVPDGIIGAAIRGMLDRVDVDMVDLLEEEPGGVRSALRSMVQALESGADAVVAADGPSGPARMLRPGAIWLARASGRPLVPVGCAVRPAIRIPRWDRLLVPLPGASSVAVFEDPIPIERRQRLDEALLSQIGDRLDYLTERAWEIATNAEHVPLAPDELKGDW